METKFQTSFIPKKPLSIEQKPHVHVGVSIFMTLAVIIFLASLGGAGFVIAWKNVLENTQATYIKDLADSQKRFDPTTIESLKKENVKIDLAKQLLAQHLSVSTVFSIISGLTIDGVNFTSLDYAAPDPKTPGSNAQITMKGIANSFSSIAWQSDVFGSSSKYGTNKIIKNPAISGLAVDLNGNVTFTFTAEISPADINYSNMFGSSTPATTSTSTSTN